MSAPMDIFQFPLDFDFQSLPNKDNKVCVVSVIGKGRHNPFASKASVFNPVLDKDVFKGLLNVPEELIQQDAVECFYDAESQVVYLHHTCMYDTYRLAVQCQRLINQDVDQDFFNMWQKEEYRHAKTLLWLFSISHIIILSHPGASFDVSYVRLFRTIDTIRLKLLHSITEQLHGFHISKDWYHSGRPCSPRVLFMFESTTLTKKTEPVETGAISKNKTATKFSVEKKLVHAIEDQIYRILRKSRIITNISNNSLFAVPANQEFVYIHTKKEEISDPVSFYLQQLRMNNSVESPRSRGYQSNRHSSQSGSETRSSSLPTSPVPGNSTFKEFLFQHVELALGRGFDDNVGRNPVTPVFEVPTCELWCMIANRLYDFFLGERINAKAQAHFNTLKSLLETDIRFSENRCNKVLPVAEAAYQEGLPTHYVTNFHLNKLQQAHRVFHQFARGPATEKYLVQLDEACEKFWKNGRQLCEEISVTGNHCINPLHRLPDEPELDSNRHLPVMPHTNQLKTRAACNCGRKQADKDDPFDHKAANYDFYAGLEESCCGKLEHVDLPSFKPSTAEARAAQVKKIERAHKNSQGDTPTVKSGDIVSGMANLSLALSLGQSGGSDYSHHEGISPNNFATTSPHVEAVEEVASEDSHQIVSTSPMEETTEKLEKVEEIKEEEPDHEEPEAEQPEEAALGIPATFRQVSTTEYLPGMIHSESVPGLLPKFPSWAVCCIGKASLYNHNTGLDYPGFLHGSHFLLPWDITVKAEKDKWPSVGETASRKGKQKKSSKDTAEVNLRIYLGNEYECPRGHRFFCSGPEKIIKVSSTSSVKDNANKLVNLDMPLYCACPHCRSSKGFLGQLMRLYVVTPEGPVRITVNPIIQPAPSPCPLFNLGTTDVVELSASALWVIRLPHIYLGDQGAYLMPTESQHLSQCRMMKGVFGYRDATQES
ncbi:nonsense-mediated mRNA decay factor SMG8-like [Mytilus edulis]|uniref:nonsense-mediated mRNA decay factor SMG8-like n=1 Tax=Mytilus edulis TaxID=6550 RepID=UPI0039EFED1A